MTDELKKILKMIEERKMTAKEAEMLIISYEKNYMPQNKNYTSINNRTLRVCVTNSNGQKDSEVKIPVSLAKIGLKFTNKFSGTNLSGSDIIEILNAIDGGTVGKILEANTNGQFIEIYIE